MDFEKAIAIVSLHVSKLEELRDGEPLPGFSARKWIEFQVSTSDKVEALNLIMNEALESKGYVG